MIPLVSYAQNFEDVLLWRALKHVDGGFYIDIGAMDPMVDSVSRVFFERGWTGIHAEPTPRYAASLRDQRPGDTVLEAAVTNKSGLITFFEIPETGISTGDPKIAQQHRDRGFSVHEITVPTVRLSSILQSCGKRDIHWMKIDVEGFELSVLTSWGQAKARPWIVVVESTLPLSQVESFQSWEPQLLKRGYTPVLFDGLNRYYVSKDKRELSSSFNAPANVFDSFTVSGTASNFLHYHLNNLHAAELASMAEKIGAAANEIGLLHAHKNAITAELAEVSAKAQQTVREYLELQASKEDLSAKLRSLDSTLQKVATENTDLNKEKDGLFVRLLEADHELQNAVAEKSAVHAEKNRLVEKLADAIAGMEQASQSLRQIHAEKTQLGVEVNRVNVDLQRLAIENAALHAHKNHLADSLGDMAGRMQVVSAEVTRLRTEDVERRAEISSLQQDSLRRSDLLLQAHVAHAAAMQLASQERQQISQLRLEEEQAHRAEALSLQTQALNASARLASAHDETYRTAQLLAGSEQHSREISRRAQQEQISQMRQIAALREHSESALLEHQSREHASSVLIAAGGEKIADLERAITIAAVEREEFLRHSAESAEQLQQLLFLARQEATAMQRSVSWQLTRPVRAIGRIFRGAIPRNLDQSPGSIVQSERLAYESTHDLSGTAPFYAPKGNTQETTMASSSLIQALPNTGRQAITMGELLTRNSSEFVKDSYATLLGRPADPTGLDFYTKQLEGGIAKIQVIVELCASDELKRKDFISVSELLTVQGENFIECAYFLLLKRLPDEEGGNAYLGQLLKGKPKIQILADIRHSEEGRNAAAAVDSLDDMISRFERMNSGWKGFLARFFSLGDGSSSAEVRLRCIEQQVAILRQEIAASSSQGETNFQALRLLIETQSTKAEERSDRLAQEVAGLQFATAQQRAQIKAVAEAKWSEGLANIQARIDRVEQNVATISTQMASLVSLSDNRFHVENPSSGDGVSQPLQSTRLESEESRGLESLPPRAREVYKNLKSK